MNRLLILFILSCLFGCAASTTQVKAPSPVPDGNISMDAFLQGAVFYGLQKDAAPVSMVEGILKGDLFVKKCPICRPVEEGMRKHLANPVTMMVKRSEDSLVAKMMNANDREAQQIALRNLIANYIDQYYTALEFTAEAKKKMESQLQTGRKKGMGLKSESFGKFCPSCDGACKIK